MKTIVEKKKEEFQKFIVENDHPCVMAQMVFKQEQVFVDEYGQLGDPGNVPKLLRDLTLYHENYDLTNNHFYTFIALFENENFSEKEFEARIWQQLQLLHNSDPHPWDPSVESNPDSENFSFSLLGRSFYIVGMHPGSSRMARQAPCPALVFNLHLQFERLREMNAYESTQQHIRERDVALQGSTNPMLADFGNDSEAKQYSGRQVDNSWKCPFHQKSENQLAR